MHLERTVVGVDFADPSAAAAAWTARHFAPGAELVLVNAIYIPEPPRFLRQLYPPTDQLVEAARRGAEQQLRDLSRTIGATLIWPEVRVGKPDEVITAVTAEYAADLIVVGPHAARPGLHAALGSTAERVLRRAICPVLLARGMTDDPPLRLLAAVDGSEMTRPVLAWTELLMRTHGSTAVLAHVVTPPAPSDLTIASGLPPIQHATTATPDEGIRAATNWLDDERRRLAHHERTEAVALVGRPAQAIVAEAERRGSDLIVLGNRGVGAVQRLLFGSVTEAVLRESTRSVLVVTA